MGEEGGRGDERKAGGGEGGRKEAVKSRRWEGKERAEQRIGGFDDNLHSGSGQNDILPSTSSEPDLLVSGHRYQPCMLPTDLSCVSGATNGEQGRIVE